MSDQKTLFVFYTFEEKARGASWFYKSLPKGWWVVGSGSTSSLGGKQLKYESEEQFQGPKVSQEKAREYLDKQFKKLKKGGIIKIYKIRNSYLP
jgi:hypothetical protein